VGKNDPKMHGKLAFWTKNQSNVKKKGKRRQWRACCFKRSLYLTTI